MLTEGRSVGLQVQRAGCEFLRGELTVGGGGGGQHFSLLCCSRVASNLKGM